MKINTKVARVLQGEGLSRETLNDMLDRAALTRERGFNRRFHEWIFLVENDSVTDMQLFQRTELGHGNSKVIEEHESCAGHGCHDCGWIGHIVRWVSDKSLPVHEQILALPIVRNSRLSIRTSANKIKKTWS